MSSVGLAQPNECQKCPCAYAAWLLVEPNLSPEKVMALLLQCLQNPGDEAAMERGRSLLSQRALSNPGPGSQRLGGDGCCSAASCRGWRVSWRSPSARTPNLMLAQPQWHQDHLWEEHLWPPSAVIQETKTKEQESQMWGLCPLVGWDWCLLSQHHVYRSTSLAPA